MHELTYTFEPFELHYKPVTTVADFKTECISAALLAARAAGNKPIIVMFSGGVDSQLIAESFLAAKIPFSCLIGELVIEVATETRVLNEHDTKFAKDWCAKHGVPAITTKLDVYQNAKLLTEYSVFSRGFSPQYAWHMYLMKWASEHGFFFVGGLGDIDIRLIDGEYFCCDTQREWSISLFCEKNKLDGIIRFCKQNSRMTAAFLKMQRVKELLERREPMLLDHKYHYFGEVFTVEQRPKLTGFEEIQEWDHHLRSYMKEINGQFDTLGKVPISFFKC